MVGDEMEGGKPWKQTSLGIHLLATLVSLTMLTAPVSADILVIDTDTNETSPIFQDLTAAFGPKFPHHGLAGRIVYSKPLDACESVQPPPGHREDNIGWVLVIARGGHCGFADKVLAAQLKGYDAVIVHNYEGHEALVRMYGNENGSFINIPSTFVGWQEGMRLKNEYDYTYKRYYVKIIEQDDINYRLYLWPFAIVVAVCFVLVMVFVVVKFVREHANRRINRLSRKHLKQIPVRKYKKGDYYDTCAICLDEYEEGEKIRVLPCDHVYHSKCIDPWLTKSKKTCPVCKRRVIPGRDADDSDSDNDGNINSSERTPLLTESNSSNTGSARSVPQYTTTTTPSLHAPGNDEGSPPISSSHSPPLSCSQQSASAHISTDGCGQVFLSQARQGRSSATTSVPTDLDGAQGAVGGAGISDQFASPSGEMDVSSQLRHDPGSRKRRKPEWRRAGVWEEEEGRPVGTASAHGSTDPVAETREERRERRRRKKEKKRRAQELSQRAVEAARDEAGCVNQPSKEGASQDIAVEIAEDVDPDAPATLSVEVLPSSAGSIQAAPDVTIRDGEEDESYINPSYSESEEVVLHNPGRRHEMNDMV